MPKMRIVEKKVTYELYDEKTGTVLYTGYDAREPEPSEVMDLEYKIHRKVLIGGKVQNVRAQSEQEYAELVAIKAVETEKEEAERRERETKHNFKLYALRWFEVSSKPNISEVCQLTYERQLRKFILPTLGEKYVEDITPEDVQEMFNAMGDVAKATKDKAGMVLNQILEVALEDGFIRFNPIKSKKVNITGRPSKVREPYTVEQMQYIVKHVSDIKNTGDRAYIALSALHPMRPEEVLGLMWDDIDFEHNIIHIQRAVTHPNRNQPVIKDTKNGGSVRDIPLSGVAKTVLESMQTRCGYIFGGDTPYTYQKVKKLCERAKKDINAGFPLTPARFRPTVITDMYHQTGDAKLVQTLAGHASFDTTIKHYINARGDQSIGATAIDSLYTQNILTP